jgi:adenine-specific DNA-methyltransferase
MTGASLNITTRQLGPTASSFFPTSFRKEKLIWRSSKQLSADDINFANERYVLNWAGKSDAFKVLQMPTTCQR